MEDARIGAMLQWTGRFVYKCVRPCNWSPRDWRDELRGVAALAGCEAPADYDASSGLPPALHVYRRIRGAIRARTREEWRYARGYLSDGVDNVPEPRAPGPPSSPDGLDALNAALTHLPAPGRALLDAIFWRGWSETEVAKELKISRQAVHKRKLKLENELRAWMRIDAPPVTKERKHLAS